MRAMHRPIFALCVVLAGIGGVPAFLASPRAEPGAAPAVAMPAGAAAAASVVPAPAGGARAVAATLRPGGPAQDEEDCGCELEPAPKGRGGGRR